MLGLGRDVPVGVALAVAREDGWVDLDGIRVVLAEVLIADRPALAIRGKVTQVAVRDVVAVGVAPATKAVRDGPRNRTGDVSGDVVRAELRDISAGGELQRGPAVAEQVVRHSKSWVDVLPAWPVVNRIVLPRAAPGGGRRG